MLAMKYRRYLALVLLWLAHKLDPDYISGLLPQKYMEQTPTDLQCSPSTTSSTVPESAPESPNS